MVSDTPKTNGFRHSTLISGGMGCQVKSKHKGGRKFRSPTELEPLLGNHRLQTLRYTCNPPPQSAIHFGAAEIEAISETREKAMLHCDLRVRWKVASDLRFGAAIPRRKLLLSAGCLPLSGDLGPSTRKSLAIAIVRFWCAKLWRVQL